MTGHSGVSQKYEWKQMAEQGREVVDNALVNRLGKWVVGGGNL